jgi:putative oxidoreductase
MLASIFVVQGAQAVARPGPLVPRAKPVTDRIVPMIEKANLPVPTDTEALVRINGAVHVVGGLMLFTPLRRVGALALAGSMIPTTLAGHPYWRVEDPVERAGQRVHFLKNLSMFGGVLLAALEDTNGRPGLRWRAEHLAHDATGAVRRSARQTRSKASIARRSASLGRKSATFPHDLVH